LKIYSEINIVYVHFEDIEVNKKKIFFDKISNSLNIKFNFFEINIFEKQKIQVNYNEFFGFRDGLKIIFNNYSKDNLFKKIPIIFLNNTFFEKHLIIVSKYLFIRSVKKIIKTNSTSIFGIRRKNVTSDDSILESSHYSTYLFAVIIKPDFNPFNFLDNENYGEFYDSRSESYKNMIINWLHPTGRLRGWKGRGYKISNKDYNRKIQSIYHEFMLYRNSKVLARKSINDNYFTSFLLFFDRMYGIYSKLIISQEAK